MSVFKRNASTQAKDDALYRRDAAERDAPAVERPGRSKTRIVGIAAAGITVVFIIGHLIGAAAGPGQETVHGAMQVQESCEEAGIDYPDIDQGTQVVVTDDTGKVLGSGALGEMKVDDSGVDFDGYGQTCDSSFSVQVPAGQARYGVEVGRRGTVWFTGDQMQRGPVLTLGS